MKFSIVIPVYNVKEYLDECITSVLNQTFKDFEIILVDDGSLDGSENICDLYSKKYPETCFTYHRTNHGVLLSREFGVKKAKGDVILFLDSDDSLRKDTLEILNKIFEKFCVGK